VTDYSHCESDMYLCAVGTIGYHARSAVRAFGIRNECLRVPDNASYASILTAQKVNIS
jgi:hypothetical protein